MWVKGEPHFRSKPSGDLVNCGRPRVAVVENVIGIGKALCLTARGSIPKENDYHAQGGVKKLSKSSLAHSLRGCLRRRELNVTPAILPKATGHRMLVKSMSNGDWSQSCEDLTKRLQEATHQRTRPQLSAASLREHNHGTWQRSGVSRNSSVCGQESHDGTRLMNSSYQKFDRCVAPPILNTACRGCASWRSCPGSCPRSPM